MVIRKYANTLECHFSLLEIKGPSQNIRNAYSPPENLTVGTTPSGRRSPGIGQTQIRLSDCQKVIYRSKEHVCTTPLFSYGNLLHEAFVPALLREAIWVSLESAASNCLVFLCLSA